MLEKIIAWIKGVLSKMLGQSSVKQALSVDIAISDAMAEALGLWAKLYQNQAPWLTRDIKSLNLPAAIAGEIARMVTIEMQVALDGSPRADYLAGQLEPVVDVLREKVEQAVALGGMILKPYVASGRLLVDYVRADSFYPVAFSSAGEITAAVFVDQRHIGDYWYTRLEYHQMTPSGCVIRNLVYRSSSSESLGQASSLDAVAEWAELLPEATVTGIDRPLFAYFRYPLANAVDPASHLGVSCYSRAVGQIEEADRIYSNLLWEFESGKRAVYVDTLAFGKDSAGKPKLPDNRLYRTIDTGGEIGAGSNKLFEGWTPDFREASIISGLDAILKKVEYNCGLAYGTLSDPQTVDKTATEIKISRQRTYATVTDTQKALRNALDELLYAMDVWATIAGLAPRGAYAATYDFDDSVVTDKELQMAQDRQTVGMGAMPKAVFLMRNYGLDEATAKKWIAETQAEQPADMFGDQVQ